MTAVRAWIDRWARLGRGWRAGAAVAWAALIWWLSSRPTLPSVPGALGQLAHNGAHVVAYAVLGALVLLAVQGGRDRAPAATALAALYGVIDELHQSFVPSRVASAGDVLSDAVGAVLGVSLTLWLWRGRRRARWIALAAVPIAVLCATAETFLPPATPP